MLLSDADIRVETAAGRVMPPSSVDFRLDRCFRVFENHRYPHIDPASDQSDLTRMGPPRARSRSSCPTPSRSFQSFHPTPVG